MKHHTVEDRWSWFERITGALIIVAVVVALLLAITAASAGADSGDLPFKIRTSGKLSEVSCAGPCCCGTVSTIISHVRYEATGYCRWWPRTIRNGQTVTTMLYRTNVQAW